MLSGTEKKRREMQERLNRLRIDVSRHDAYSVCMSGEGILTVEDLEALLYLMKELPDWQLTPEGDQ